LGAMALTLGSTIRYFIEECIMIEILTHDGLKQFDMSSYSLTHGIETAEKIMESRVTTTEVEEHEEEE